VVITIVARREASIKRDLQHSCDECIHTTPHSSHNPISVAAREPEMIEIDPVLSGGERFYPR